MERCNKHRLKILCSFSNKIVHVKEDVFSYNNARFNLALLFTSVKELENTTLKYFIFTIGSDLAQEFISGGKKQLGTSYNIKYDIEFFAQEIYNFGSKKSNLLYCPFLLKHDLSEILPVTWQELNYSVEEKLLFTKAIIYLKDIQTMEVPVLKKENIVNYIAELPERNNKPHHEIEETIEEENDENWEEDLEKEIEESEETEEEITKVDENEKVSFDDFLDEKNDNHLNELSSKKWTEVDIVDPYKNETQASIDKLKNEYYDLKEKDLSDLLTPEEKIRMHNLSAFIIPMELKEFYQKYEVKLPDYSVFVRD